jgi:hypothetical protein
VPSKCHYSASGDSDPQTGVIVLYDWAYVLPCDARE